MAPETAVETGACAIASPQAGSLLCAPAPGCTSDGTPNQELVLRTSRKDAGGLTYSELHT